MEKPSPPAPDFSAAFQWPIEDPEIAQVLATLARTGDWGRYHAGHAENLEAELRECFGLPFVRLCSSGTIGVELALRAMGVQPEDEVVVAAYDFPGNFRAIEAVGARPVLVDIDPESWSMSVDSLEKAVGPNVRSIIVSHLHGGHAEIREIMDLARRHGWSVIEDICQCPGASSTSEDQSLSPLGSFGDAAVISFGGSKLLTAGRGGALLMKSERMQQQVIRFSDRGNDSFPISELQAAVVLPQLKKLDARNTTRLVNASEMLNRVKSIEGVHSVSVDESARPAFYKLPFRFPAATPADVDRLIVSLQALGIVIDRGFRGFHKRSERRCRKPTNLNHSQAAAEQTLVLHHPFLLSPEFDAVANEIVRQFSEFTATIN